MTAPENPFDRFDIDPLLGARGITERMRDLALEASEEARVEIRAAWEELTLHPARRLKAAFGAHPETRATLGSPPPARAPAATILELSLVDVARRPSVMLALARDSDDVSSPLDVLGGALEDDPILTRP